MDTVRPILFCALISFLLLLVSAQKDHIQVGESIAALTGTLESRNGTFKLGFFKTALSRWYLGIWLGDAEDQSVVWVANRNNPILQIRRAKLSLWENGTLLLLDGLGFTVWSSNTSGAANVSLLDNGNLVVSGRHGQLLWQSFDNPGDTWLPGMKISNGQKLTSWKNANDPAEGLFTLEMDPIGANQFVLMWNRTVRYWQSGAWNGHIFSGLPEMATKYVYDFSFIRTATDKYFTYSLKPNVDLLTRFVLDKAGEMRLYTASEGGPWSMIWAKPADRCQIYGFCGDYGVCSHDEQGIQFCRCPEGFSPTDASAWGAQDWSLGCSRRIPLRSCHPSQNASTDRFLKLNGIFPSDDEEAASATAAPTILQCMQTCRQDCSCTALTYAASSAASKCRLWGGPLATLHDGQPSQPSSLYLRMPADAIRHANSGRRTREAAALYAKLVIATSCLAAASVIAVITFVWYKLQTSLKDQSDQSSSATPVSLRMYSYKELQAATRNFSERLGGGGFGSVYKGTLPDKTAVAVKTLENSQSESHGEKQFRMEVCTIGTIQHVNLVRLRGFCSQKNLRMLVYDYMPNGSLNNFLFPAKSSANTRLPLDWKTRFSVALGTARGIQYLHDKCRDRIIHCDIKPENILLDSDFCAKVADFGLAKLVGRDFSEVVTTMRGTRGYLAPEWLSGLPITTKADVYSYGMTLLEIVSGRRNLDFHVAASRAFYPTWAGQRMQDGDFIELVDEKVRASVARNPWEREQVRRAALIAGWCIQDEAHARPCMSHVVNVLEGMVDVAEVPPVPSSLLLFMEQTAGTPRQSV